MVECECECECVLGVVVKEGRVEDEWLDLLQYRVNQHKDGLRSSKALESETRESILDLDWFRLATHIYIITHGRWGLEWRSWKVFGSR